MKSLAADGSKRSLLLGGGAALMVLVLAIDTLFVRAPEPVAVSTAPAAAPAAEGLAPGAPRDLGPDGLAERYRQVLKARPFAVRSFKEPPPRPAARPSAQPGPTTAPPPGTPPPVSLRFTGVVREGAAPIGVLEAYGTGQGLLARPGLQVGPFEVAAVTTGVLVVSGPGGARQEVPLGEKIDVEAAQMPPLEPLSPAAPDPAVGGGGAATRNSGGRRAGTPSAPPISEEKRESILERLRARRRASLDDGGGGE